MSESTKSDLDSLLREVKKEQGSAEMPMSSGSGSGVFSHMSQTLPPSRRRLSRDPTLDAALQHELKETHEKSHSSYRKLQVSIKIMQYYNSGLDFGKYVSTMSFKRYKIISLLYSLGTEACKTIDPP